MSPIIALSLTAAILVTGTGIGLFALKKATIDAPRKGVQARRRRSQAKSLTKLGDIDFRLSKGEHVSEREIYKAQRNYWKKDKRLILGKTYTLSEKENWELTPERKLKRFTPRGAFLFKRVSKKDQAYLNSQKKFLEAKVNLSKLKPLNKSRTKWLKRRINRIDKIYAKKTRNGDFKSEVNVSGSHYIRTMSKNYAGGIQDNRVSMQSITDESVKLFEQLDKTFPDVGLTRNTIQVHTAEFVLPEKLGIQNSKLVSNDMRIYRAGKIVLLKELMQKNDEGTNIFPINVVTKESDYPDSVKEVKIKNAQEFIDYYNKEAEKTKKIKDYDLLLPILQKVDSDTFTAQKTKKEIKQEVKEAKRLEKEDA